MIDPVELHGYHLSVYNRIARMALFLKGVDYGRVEVNPFEDLPDAYLALHPFGRVPVLVHGRFSLFETGAITRYVDRTFAGPALQPGGREALARMDQVISIVDSYAYWPMVRQVFSHGFFRAVEGAPSDPAAVSAGLEAARKVLSVLDGLAAEGHVLTGEAVTLADCHLVPMVDYFTRAAAGRDALADYPSLTRWWDRVSPLDMVTATDPLPDR